MEFVEFPKISRLNREAIITEKLDGTNAQVLICTHEQLVIARLPDTPAVPVTRVGDACIYAGSRTRFITPADDNFGFAVWVLNHADELVAGLGNGLHFGEWWGQGIQRNYGLKEKRFSLFNTSRWGRGGAGCLDLLTPAPECCHVVPELGRGEFMHLDIQGHIDDLRAGGSLAVPGFMKPEGIVVFHTHSNTCFKYTFDKHDGHKGNGE